MFQIHLRASGRFTARSSLQNVFNWPCVRIRLLLAWWTRLLTVLGPDELVWCSSGKWTEVSLCVILRLRHCCKSKHSPQNLSICLLCHSLSLLSNSSLVLGSLLFFVFVIYDEKSLMVLLQFTYLFSDFPGAEPLSNNEKTLHCLSLSVLHCHAHPL